MCARRFAVRTMRRCSGFISSVRVCSPGLPLPVVVCPVSSEAARLALLGSAGLPAERLTDPHLTINSTDGDRMTGKRCLGCHQIGVACCPESLLRSRALACARGASPSARCAIALALSLLSGYVVSASGAVDIFPRRARGDAGAPFFEPNSCWTARVPAGPQKAKSQ